MKFRIITIILLVLFTSYTLYTMAIAEQSLLNFGYQLITSFDTAQVVFDLYIMTFLAICWMYGDSQVRGKPKWYFVSFAILTLVFVAIGPLLYLALKPSDENE